jgi:hypothetical protein
MSTAQRARLFEVLIHSGARERDLEMARELDRGGLIVPEKIAHGGLSLKVVHGGLTLTLPAPNQGAVR